MCPKDLYDAFASVMAQTEEAAHFEVLRERVGQTLGREPADYLMRACIRFWMQTSPRLMEKVRTRYQSRKKSAFRTDARRVWRDAGGK